MHILILVCHSTIIDYYSLMQTEVYISIIGAHHYHYFQILNSPEFLFSFLLLIKVLIRDKYSYYDYGYAVKTGWLVLKMTDNKGD